MTQAIEGQALSPFNTLIYSFGALQLSPSIHNPSSLCPMSPTVPCTPDFEAQRKRIAVPPTPHSWDGSQREDDDWILKSVFIRTIITETEIDILLEEMNVDPPDSYEECIDLLIGSRWRPNEEHFRRHKVYKSTFMANLEEDEDERTVTFECGNKQYLASKTIDELRVWLYEHYIRHDIHSKSDLVDLVHRMFVVHNHSPMDCNAEIQRKRRVKRVQRVQRRRRRRNTYRNRVRSVRERLVLLREEEEEEESVDEETEEETSLDEWESDDQMYQVQDEDAGELFDGLWFSL